MKKGNADADLRRRGFLLAGGAGVAGAVTVAIAPIAEQAAPAAAAAPKPGDAGYRESEHVRTYYDLARV